MYGILPEDTYNFDEAGLYDGQDITLGGCYWHRET
jgi:hypothetical protein